jgi:hypothetical protein
MEKTCSKQKRYIASKIVIGMALIIIIFICKLTSLYSQNKPFPLKSIDEQRVKEIALLLKDKPKGFGDPYNKRDIWDKLLQSGKYDQFLKEMKSFSFPPFSKEDYFSLSDGTASSSGRGLQMMRNRAKGLSQATWAECLENKGRYTKMVEDGLSDIINQKSWVSPRIDFDFKNYKGIEYSVELTSSLYAHTIAQTLYLMGDKLSPELRKDAVDALYKRVFNPVLNKIQTQNQERENSFLVATNNWNHVCLAGLVGAALTILDDKHERAVFTYIGEYYSQNGLIGFGDDGYCSEGVGYYNYGFGHYILLREDIWQATDGKLDLFAKPKVQKIASYVPNLEVINGVFPSISDSHQGVKPDASIMNYLSRNLGLGLLEYDTLTFEGKTDDNRNEVMMVFPNSASMSEPRKVKRSEDQIIRSFFDQTGVLITRPVPGSSCNMGVAFKGGNNQENHNHNDVGSYTIVLGDEIMAGDPGAIPYTANIFDEKYRYTYKTVGSFGHPVPLVAGKEQQPGAQAKAKTIRKEFTQNKDELELDIASAYNVPELKKLERTMSYNRTGEGSVTVTDDFVYSQPEAFETAISTRAKWEKTSNNTLFLTKGKEKLLVTFSSPGNKLSIRSEEITEGGIPYSRIGIYIGKPVNSGQIIITYKPAK